MPNMLPRLYQSRVLFAGLVETLQVGGTVSIGLGHAVDERFEGGRVVVQTHEKLLKFILMSGESCIENSADRPFLCLIRAIDFSTCADWLL